MSKDEETTFFDFLVLVFGSTQTQQFQIMNIMRSAGRTSILSFSTMSSSLWNKKPTSKIQAKGEVDLVKKLLTKNKTVKDLKFWNPLEIYALDIFVGKIQGSNNPGRV